MRELLTSHVKYLLEHPEELQTDKYKKPQTRGKFFSDRRKDAEKAIEYLTFLAEHLPEKQSGKVFTRETLEPLVHAILATFKEKQEPFKNLRIFNIALMLLNEGENAAWALLPNREVSLLMTNQRVSEKSRIIRTLSYFIDTYKGKEKMRKRVKQ